MLASLTTASVPPDGLKKLGILGRHGYQPPTHVSRDENGYEDIDAYFEDSEPISKKRKRGGNRDDPNSDTESNTSAGVRSLVLGIGDRVEGSESFSDRARQTVHRERAVRILRDIEERELRARPQGGGRPLMGPSAISSPVRATNFLAPRSPLRRTQGTQGSQRYRGLEAAEYDVTDGPHSPAPSMDYGADNYDEPNDWGNDNDNFNDNELEPEYGDAISNDYMLAGGDTYRSEAEDYTAPRIVGPPPRNRFRARDLDRQRRAEDRGADREEADPQAGPSYEYAEYQPPKIVETKVQDIPKPHYTEVEIDDVAAEIIEEDDEGSDDDEVLSMIDDPEHLETDQSDDFDPNVGLPEDRYPQPRGEDSEDDSDYENFDPIRDGTMADESTLIVPEVEPRPSGILRRSARNRVLPVEFWKGDRVVYKLDDAGLPEVEKVVTVEIPERPTRKYRRRRRFPMADALDDGFEYGGEADVAPTEVQAEIFNQSRRVFEERTVAKSINGLDFHVHADNPRVRSAELIPSMRGLPFQSTVMLIDRRGAIDRRNAGSYLYAFVVLAGTLAVTLHDKTFESRRGMVFEVPRGNDFAIENTGSTQARMLVVQMKSDAGGASSGVNESLTSLNKMIDSDSASSVASAILGGLEDEDGDQFGADFNGPDKYNMTHQLPRASLDDSSNAAVNRPPAVNETI